MASPDCGGPACAAGVRLLLKCSNASGGDNDYECDAADESLEPGTAANKVKGYALARKSTKRVKNTVSRTQGGPQAVGVHAVIVVSLATDEDHRNLVVIRVGQLRLIRGVHLDPGHPFGLADGLHCRHRIGAQAAAWFGHHGYSRIAVRNRIGHVHILPRKIAMVTTSPADLRPGAAFFDVDNTIVRGASLFHIGRGFRSRGYLRFRDLLGFVWKQIKYISSGQENLADISSVQASALALIAGHSVDKLRADAEEIFDERLAHKLWAEVLELARQHRLEGREVYLVTATPVEVATLIARRLGLSGALGTRSELIDGIYTGKLEGRPLHGPEKAIAVRALATEQGFSLAKSSAYSDSINDLPLLTMVGNPNAVNPDRKLKKFAQAHGWQVYDFRRRRSPARWTMPTVVIAGVTTAVVLAAGIYWLFT